MAQSQNKGLSEHQRRASWLRTGPSAHWRQRGRRATTRAGRWGAISTPEMASSNKLWAGSQLPTKSSSNPGWLTSAGRVTVRDQLPRGDTRHTWDGAPTAHPGNRGAGTGEVIRCTTHLRRERSPNTWSPELLGPGKGTKRRPKWVCAFVEYLRTWPEWEVHTTQGLLWKEPLQSNLEPEQCGLGKHTCREWGQSQCGPDTASSPHTHQWYLFAVFLPPHTQLNKLA